MVYSAYGGFLYTFFLAPIVFLTFLVLVVSAAIRKMRRRCLSLIVTLLLFVAVSGAVLMKQDAIRDHIRWLLSSRTFKAKVLAQSVPVNGELRHMEWEATGFAGVANNAAYLVFDPADSLSALHAQGEFQGIPCKVSRVRRLENYWYSVWFYTDEVWDDCPSSRSGVP